MKAPMCPGRAALVAGVLAALAFLGCGDRGTSSDSTASLGPAEPPVGKALAGLELFEGWSQPRALAVPVNTTGWEDSSFIAPDGATLYFGYSRLSSVNSPDPDLHEAAVGVDGAPTAMAFVRFDPAGDLHMAERRGAVWANVQRLPAPLNTPCVEDNPHLSPDGRALYFDSNRADPAGTSCRSEPGAPRRDIYRSERRDGAWSAPQLLPGAPNQTEVRWQVFVEGDGGTAYWSGRDADCSPAVSCLYRARRQGDGSYAERTLVARATPPSRAAPGDVIALGEASLTADGRFLYFTYIESLAGGGLDLSLGVARRP